MTDLLPPPDALGLPYDHWRPHQAEAVLTALDAETRFVALALPTGAGKSAIAMAIAELSGRSSATLTATKGLEDQYVEVFGRALDLVDVRGMGNYPCHAAETQFKTHFALPGAVTCDQGPCKTGETCDTKNQCAYYRQVGLARRSSLVTTNYAFWVNRRRQDLLSRARRERAGGTQERQTLPELSTRGLLLLDEAHDAPSQLADQLTVRITTRDAPLPPQRQVRTVAEWRSWATGLKGTVAPRLTQGRMSDRLKAADFLLRLEQVSRMPEDWVVDRQARQVEFAPVLVAQYAETYLFCHIDRVILLSATLTPSTLTQLGIAPEDVTWVRTPSPFPVIRRPIYLLKHDPPMRIDHRITPAMERWWVTRMDEILDARGDRKGIIHTVSYHRQETIRRLSRHASRFLAPQSARELAEVVERFKRLTPDSGVVLLSPSVVTGWDFPGTDCEFQIVAKVPFPDTRSPVAQARSDADPQYRTTHAIQQMAQAIGRGMRSRTDQCETFIMDDHARWVVFRNQEVVPSWVLDAVQVVDRLPTPPLSLTRNRTAEE